jgi:hypothetical protein
MPKAPFSNVDLPAPFGPIIPTSFPDGIETDTSSNALTLF